MAWGHDPWRVTALPQMTSFFKPYRSPRWRYCDVMTKQNKTQQWAQGGHLHHGDMDNWSVLWLRGNNSKSRWWPLVKRHNWCVYKSGFGPSQGPSSGAFNAVLRELTCCRACAQINNYRWGAYLVVGLVSKVVPGLVGPCGMAGLQGPVHEKNFWCGWHLMDRRLVSPWSWDPWEDWYVACESKTIQI